jgi:crotonobetainyl-CoA:carnitine CoA-transferase CaiB-like acyl-CoA transferase
VLDLGRIWSGPFVGAHLADLGAKVIKVESRTVPDNARLRGAPVDPPARAGADPLEVVPYFLNLNRGKLGVDLDLRADAARLAFLRLASGADALIENFTAEVMPRLGLGRDVLSAAAPALVHLAMPPSLGLGSLAGMRAYAPIMTATGGLEGLVGYAGEEPVGMLTVGYGDPNAAAHALVALLAVWCARTRGAAWAREVTLPQTEATVATLGEPLMEAVGGSAPGPSGNRREYLAVSVIERREGGYVATSGADGQPASESRVLTLRELEAHAHWRARGLTTLIDHPVAGPVQIWLLPWLTETGRPWPAGPAPLLGQHDDLLTAGGRPPEP